MMTPRQLRELIDDVNADITRMVRATTIKGEVRDAIRHRAQQPLEEQLIDEDATGQRRGEPRILRVNGAKLKIWKIHRAGLLATDIKGADLYYEIEGEKYALVQYKSPSSAGRVTKDPDQLSVLKQSCPQACNPRKRFTCGSWFALRDGDEGSYFPACEAENIFGTYASRKKAAFINGLSKGQFQDEFSTCLIGARTHPINLSAFRLASIEADHVLFEVVQTTES